MKKVRKEVIVVVSKKDWRAIKDGDIRILQIFFPEEERELKEQFGKNNSSIKVKITPA
jgi:hypothetical protein